MNKSIEIWGKNISQFESVQKEFERVVGSLLETYFKKSDDYTQEKFIKCCADQIRPLEKLLLLQEGIKPNEISMNPQKIMEVFKTTENTMLSCINRMFRHTITYLTAVRSGQPIKRQ